MTRAPVRCLGQAVIFDYGEVISLTPSAADRDVIDLAWSSSGWAECGHVDCCRVAGRPIGQRVDRVDVNEAVASGFPC